MAGSKFTALGRSEVVEISVDLTPEQRRLIFRITGKNPEKLELTACELKMILRPNTFSDKDLWKW